MELDEAIALAMQVEDGEIADVVGDEAVAHHRHVVHGGIEVEQGAGAHHQRIEIGGQHPVNEAAAHQLGDGDVRPVDLRLIDILADQLVAVAAGKLRHARGVGLLRGAGVLARVVLGDAIDEAMGQRDAGRAGAAGADQQGAAHAIALTPPQLVSDVLDRKLRRHRPAFRRHPP